MMSAKTDSKLLNAFIHGYITKDPVDIKNARKWFDKFAEYGVQRDAKSFLYMLTGYTQLDDMEGVKELLEQLANGPRNGSTSLNQVLEAIRYAPDASAIENVKGVLNQKFGIDVEGIKTTSDKILDQLDALTNSSPIINDTVSEDVEKSKINDASSTTRSALQSEDLLAVPSTGIGALRRNLSYLTKETLSLYDMQRKLEEEAYKIAHEELDQLRKAGVKIPNATIPKRLVIEWHNRIVPLIKQEVQGFFDDSLDSGYLVNANPDKKSYGPFLSLVDPEKVSLITITELLGGFLSNKDENYNALRTTNLFHSIGTSIEREYNLTMLKNRSNRHLMSQKLGVWNLYATGRIFDAQMRELAKKLEEDMSLRTDWVPKWPDVVSVKLGAFLVSLLVDHAQVPFTTRDILSNEIVEKTEPAFRHITLIERGKKYGAIVFSEHLASLLTREPLKEALNPRLLPMLVHPRPWLTWNGGGYLESPGEFGIFSSWCEVFQIANIINNNS